MKCIYCKKKIPQARLNVLPDTETCVKCSTVKPLVGVTVWDKSTAELITMDEDKAKQHKSLEKYDGCFSRL